MLRRQSAIPQTDFNSWWAEQLPGVTGARDEAAWLRLGTSYGVRQLTPALSEQLTSADLEVCVAALGLGVHAEPGRELANGMLRAVLDGHASDAPGRAGSEASALLVAMRPQWFHQAVPGKPGPTSVANSHLVLTSLDQAARNSAWIKLTDRHAEYTALRAAARKGQLSQRGTTEQWQGPARELARLHGPCWLAAEIAITGAAAAELVGSGSKDRDGAPLGENTDYGTLVVEVRKRPNAMWWQKLHTQYPDTLSRRTWALALLAAGIPEAVAPNLELIDEVLTSLSPADFSATAASSSRISQNGSARQLPLSVDSASLSARTRLLLAHFQHPRFGLRDIPALSTPDLINFACAEPAYWPIAEALAARMVDEPRIELLAGLTRLGIDSLSGVSGRVRPLEFAVAQAILRSPGAFPTEWVLHAQESSRPPAGAVLENLALEAKWVPRVPRL
jgi:hypothetical protein